MDDKFLDAPIPDGDGMPTPEEMEAHHYTSALWFWDLFIGYDHWPPYTFLTLVGP
jgi:hypothetical protein